MRRSIGTNGEGATRVLGMCLSGIGDALGFSPFIDELTVARPDIQLDVLVMFQGARSLYEIHPRVNRTIYVNFLGQSAFRSVRDVFRLRRGGYHAIVAGFPSNRWEYNLIQVMIGGRRVGHRYLHYDLSNLHFLKTDWVREDPTLHTVQKNLQLLRFFAVPAPKEPGRMRLHLSADDHAAASDWLSTHVGRRGLLVGFHPGTATFKNHVQRRWPAEKFAELARKLVDAFGADVLVLGGPDERALRREICERSGRWESVHAVDGLSLRESAAVVEACALMVSNDSALMHVAAAVGTPVVAIFGYTDPRGSYPWRVPHRVVRKALPCSPCFFYSPKPASCHGGLEYACIRTIGVEEVLSAAKSLLEESSVRDPRHGVSEGAPP